MRQSIKNDNYQIDMWAHETYVLNNRPFNIGNLELPDEQFSFSSMSETFKAKCFLKSL